LGGADSRRTGHGNKGRIWILAYAVGMRGPLRTTVTSDIKVGHFAVAFLDLLDQKDQMRKMTDAYVEAFQSDPGAFNPEEKNVRWNAAMERLRQTVRDSAGAVEAFVGWYDYVATSTERAREDLLRSLPGDQRSIVEAGTREKVYRFRLPDGLVLFMEIRPSPEHSPMVALLNLLSTCCQLTLVQLAEGHPFRGGIDVGIGATVRNQTGETHIYGPALVGAYELECKTASYPRVAIGRGLVRCLDDFLQLKAEAPAVAIQRNAAKQTKDLLFTDASGVLMLDFLGKGFRSADPERLNGEDIRKARDFVAAEVLRWSADSSDKGRKLHGRYLELADYFQRRMYLWT